MNWSYIVGMIDGDGTISALKINKKNQAPLYQPYIMITNSNEVLMKELHQKLHFDQVLIHTGGYAKTRSMRGYIKGFKIRSLLEKIAPYLIVKKKQAEKLIEYIKSRENKKIGGRYGPPIDEEERTLVESVRSMNKKSKTLQFKIWEQIRDGSTTLKLKHMTL